MHSIAFVRVYNNICMILSTTTTYRILFECIYKCSSVLCWQSLKSYFFQPKPLTFFFQDAMLDETLHATKQHEAMVENHRSKFVGRKTLTKECLKHLKEMASGGILSLIGKSGTGKSAVLVKYYIRKFYSKAWLNIFLGILL